MADSRSKVGTTRPRMSARPLKCECHTALATRWMLRGLETGTARGTR